MFERYTEEARRSIFFARYEASSLASGYIETEHLLLGILRQDKVLRGKLPVNAIEQIRKQLEARIPRSAEQIATSVDLPLSADSKRALAYGDKERQSLGHKFIDSGHLVLGILRIQDCTAVDLLRQNGIDYAGYRTVVEQQFQPEPQPPAPAEAAAPSLEGPITTLEALVSTTAERLDAFSEADGLRPLKRKPWSRKEALGHLIDWATTHHQWLARAVGRMFSMMASPNSLVFNLVAPSIRRCRS